MTVCQASRAVDVMISDEPQYKARNVKTLLDSSTIGGRVSQAKIEQDCSGGKG